MVKTKCPMQTKFDMNIRTAIGHTQTVEYITTVSL